MGGAINTFFQEVGPRTVEQLRLSGTGRQHFEELGHDWGGLKPHLERTSFDAEEARLVGRAGRSAPWAGANDE